MLIQTLTLKLATEQETLFDVALFVLSHIGA